MLVLKVDACVGRTEHHLISDQIVAPSMQPSLPFVTLRMWMGECLAPFQQGWGAPGRVDPAVCGEGTGVMLPTSCLEADLWGLGPSVRLGLREAG